jgi:hypothetical protein
MPASARTSPWRLSRSRARRLKAGSSVGSSAAAVGPAKAGVDGLAKAGAGRGADPTACEPPPKSASCGATSGPQDARQPVRELGRDRGPVAAAGLATAEHGVEGGLDDVVARLPGERPVVGDEDDRPADPVADRVGVRVAHVGDGDAVVVAHARDRALVGAKRRARQQQPATRRPECARESLAPGELLAEVVGLVCDDERVTGALRRPMRGRRGGAGVRRDDAVEVARRSQLGGVRRELNPEAIGGLGPLARQRRRRAQHVDAAHDARAQQPAGEHEARNRLARAGRGGQQEGATIPRRHALEGAFLQGPQGGQGAAVEAMMRTGTAAQCARRIGRIGVGAGRRRQAGHGRHRVAASSRVHDSSLSLAAGGVATAVPVEPPRARERAAGELIPGRVSRGLAGRLWSSVSPTRPARPTHAQEQRGHALDAFGTTTDEMRVGDGLGAGVAAHADALSGGSAGGS